MSELQPEEVAAAVATRLLNRGIGARVDQYSFDEENHDGVINPQLLQVQPPVKDSACYLYWNHPNL
jgi:hypothetical protein